MKFVVFSILVFLASFSLISSAEGQIVTTSPNEITWNKILPFDTVSDQFVLTNTSTASVECVITGLKHPFWIEGDTVFTLAPQSTKTITVFFVTTDVQGATFADSLVIVTDAGAPYSHVTLNGIGKPYNSGVMSLSADQLDFGPNVAGTFDTLPLTVTNQGGSNVTVSAFVESGVKSQGSFTLTKSVTLKNVVPLTSFTMYVRFHPASAGTFYDTLHIQTNDTTHPNILLPIQGVGLPGVGTMQITSTGLDFGKVYTGTSDTLQLTVTNTGEFDLAASVGIKSGTTTPFLFDGDYSALTIPSESAKVVRVVFMPQMVGTFKDSLVFHSNDVAHSLVTLPITGEEELDISSVEETAPLPFRIYPAIVQRGLTIQSSSSLPTRVAVIDLLGQTRLQSEMEQPETTLDLSSLPNGMYVCLVQSGSATNSQRFIVSH